MTEDEAKQTVMPGTEGPAEGEAPKEKEEKAHNPSMWFAVCVDANTSRCVIVTGNTQKEFKKALEDALSGSNFNILKVIKGKQMKFEEKKVISFSNDGPELFNGT